MTPQVLLLARSFQVMVRRTADVSFPGFGPTALWTKAVLSVFLIFVSPVLSVFLIFDAKGTIAVGDAVRWDPFKNFKCYGIDFTWHPLCCGGMQNDQSCPDGRVYDESKAYDMLNRDQSYGDYCCRMKSCSDWPKKTCIGGTTYYEFSSDHRTATNEDEFQDYCCKTPAKFTHTQGGRKREFAVHGLVSRSGQSSTVWEVSMKNPTEEENARWSRTRYVLKVLKPEYVEKCKAKRWDPIKKEFDILKEIQGTPLNPSKHVIEVICSGENGTPDPAFLKMLENEQGNQTKNGLETVSFAIMKNGGVEFRKLTDQIHLDTNSRLSNGEILYFFNQLVEALEFIRDKHIVHQDLKPANILVSRNCDLTVIDFGSADVVPDDIERVKDDVEFFVVHLGVTPLYTDESIWRTFRDVSIGNPQEFRKATKHTISKSDKKSLDIYALGVILYELAVHKLPYSSLQDFDKDLDPCRSDKNMQKLCDGMLNQDMEDRYDLKQVREVVNKWKQNVTATPPKHLCSKL